MDISALYKVPIYPNNQLNSKFQMFLIIQIIAYAIITFLTLMTLILLGNFLIRPSLWTAFNIVMLIYFFFNIILGSLKIYMISLIISQNLEPLHIMGEFGDVVAEQLARYDKMEEACTIYIYWSGTALLREALLTGMIFTR